MKMLRLENMGNEELYNVIEDAEFRIVSFTEGSKDCLHPYIKKQKAIIDIATKKLARRRQAEHAEIERLGIEELEILRSEYVADYGKYLNMSEMEFASLSRYLQEETSWIQIVDAEIKHQQELHDNVKYLSDEELQQLTKETYLKTKPQFGRAVEKKDIDFLKFLNVESDRRAKTEKQTIEVRNLKFISDEDLETLRREKTADIEYWNRLEQERSGIELLPMVDGLSLMVEDLSAMIEDDIDLLHEIIEEMMEREEKKFCFENLHLADWIDLLNIKNMLIAELDEVKSLGVDIVRSGNYHSFIAKQLKLKAKVEKEMKSRG